METKGPSIDPFGTPALIFNISELDIDYTARCFQSFRYSLNQSRRVPEMPAEESLCSLLIPYATLCRKL